jgi:hypothetical protein
MMNSIILEESIISVHYGGWKFSWTYDFLVSTGDAADMNNRKSNVCCLALPAQVVADWIIKVSYPTPNQSSFITFRYLPQISDIKKIIYF